MCSLECYQIVDARWMDAPTTMDTGNTRILIIHSELCSVELISQDFNRSGKRESTVLYSAVNR